MDHEERRQSPDRRQGTLNRQDKRWLLAVNVPLAFLAAMAVIVALLVIVRPESLISPDYEYSRPMLADAGGYCPGDTLRYSYHLKVNRGPLMLQVVRSFYSPDRGYNVVPDDTPEGLAHAVAHPDALVEREIQVPATLTPGRYELHHGSQQERAIPLVMTFPFTVKEGC